MHDYVDIAGPSGSTTLFFIHGAGINRKMWLPEFDNLQDRYRCVSVDLPGHGARIEEKYDFEESTRAVEAAIDEHTAGPVLLIGLSLGGYVAMGTRHPRIAGLVLSGSSAAYTGWGGLSTKLYGLAITPLTPFVRRANEKALRKALADEVADEIIRHGLSLRSAVRALRTIPGPDYRGMLARFDVPVLLLNGERDKGNREEEADCAAAAGDATIVMVEDAGHACSLTQPEAFSEAIHQFCRERVAV
jgi:pimeloyl-ACP methyl ester carboxylesterase